jgi:hypothetical protein
VFNAWPRSSQPGIAWSHTSESVGRRLAGSAVCGRQCLPLTDSGLQVSTARIPGALSPSLRPLSRPGNSPRSVGRWRRCTRRGSARRPPVAAIRRNAPGGPPRRPSEGEDLPVKGCRRKLTGPSDGQPGRASRPPPRRSPNGCRAWTHLTHYI